MGELQIRLYDEESIKQFYKIKAQIQLEILNRNLSNIETIKIILKDWADNYIKE